MARRQLELSNEVAAELAGVPGRRSCARSRSTSTARSSCAATSSRSTATPTRCRPARPSCASCRSLVERGHDIGPATIESVARVLDQRESPAQRARGRRLAPPQPARSRRSRSTRSATSTRSAARRSRSASARPAPARRSWRSRWRPPRSRAREVNRIILTRPAVEAGERLGFLPGDLMAKVDPYLRPLFDALHDMMDAERVAAAPGEGRDRGRAARVHARPHAQRLVRDPRRGAEHDARADEDVPHAARLRLAGWS